MLIVFYCPRETCTNHYGWSVPEADWQMLVDLFDELGCPLTGTTCYCGTFIPMEDLMRVEDDWKPKIPPDQITTSTPDDTPIPGAGTDTTNAAIGDEA